MLLQVCRNILIKGYLESSMINMLARLGWSKGDKEIFYIEDLIS